MMFTPLLSRNHKLPTYLDHSAGSTALAEKLCGTAEVLRDLETATQDEVITYEDQ